MTEEYTKGYRDGFKDGFQAGTPEIIKEIDAILQAMQEIN